MSFISWKIRFFVSIRKYVLVLSYFLSFRHIYTTGNDSYHSFVGLEAPENVKY